MRHDAVRGQAEASQLLWRQDVDDERSHMGHVPGGQLAARVRKPSSVRMALVNRPSAR